MEREKIIDGLNFTVAMFLFDPTTGDVRGKERLNDEDRLTVDACEAAIEELRPGTWESIRGNFNRRRCSKCKEVYKLADVAGLQMKHCPNCGQKKRDL